MRWVLALVIAAGCYQPTPAPGAPCGPDGACPSGLTCQGEVCVLPGVPGDGPRADGSVDDGPRPDTPPPDGPPNLSGCSDGEREGFAELALFPTIAGCEASWATPQDMRAAKTGGACGDDLATCERPADACAPGWSVCGLDGDPTQLSTRASAEACLSAAPTGAFVSAMSHCTSFVNACDYSTPLPCLVEGDCSEAVCCGPSCRNDIGCSDGVYPTATQVGGVVAAGCGAMDAANVTGVLCCLD